MLRVLAVAVVVVLPSCVTSGTYDELVIANERTKKDLVTADLLATSEVHKREQAVAAAKASQATLSAELNQARADLKAEQTRATTLAAEKSSLQQQLTTASSELKRTSDDLASTVKDKAGLKSSVDEMKAALDELNKRKAEADRRITEYRNLLARFQSLIDAGKLKVKIVDGRMVVALASDILFASGSAGLSKEGKASVEEVAAVLSSIPDRKFQVEGHTDNVPIKTAQFPSNWELASSRSLTVLKTMVEAGMPAGRVSAASFGESKPTAPNDSADNRALNRRIEIVVVPDLSTLPGFDELKLAGSPTPGPT